MRQHVRAGRAVQAGPFAPRAVFKPRQRRDQFGFGAKSIFVVPIERRSNIGQQRDVLILVRRSEPKTTAAARAASSYPNPRSSAIATKQRQLSAVRPRKPAGMSGLRLRLQRAAHFPIASRTMMKRSVSSNGFSWLGDRCSLMAMSLRSRTLGRLSAPTNPAIAQVLR